MTTPFANYECNVKIIDELNARDSKATNAVNQLSAMSFDEFASVYLKTSPIRYGNVIR